MRVHGLTSIIPWPAGLLLLKQKLLLFFNR
jgi:hypothetical protein